jgi:AcrR family transcriptional regulator
MSEETDGRVLRGQASREIRHQQIKEAALQVFADKGYHNTSVTDLVAAAGVARGTFYIYFESKESLFLELLDDLVAELRAGIKGVDPAAEAGVRAQLPAVIGRVLHTVSDNRALTRILFREAIGLDAEVDERLAAFNDQIHDYVVRALRLGRAMGVVREELDLDVAADCIVGGVRYIVQRHIVADEASIPDIERLSRGVVATYLDGVAGSPDGRAPSA